MKEDSVADALAGILNERGVTNVFGVPGGPSIPVINALNRHDIGFVLTSHESAAAVMADVTARLTGVPGVCHSTYGPGATNMSTGVGGALLDRSPLLALTTVVSDCWAGRTTQMNIDHSALFSPVTKATARLTPGDCCSVINAALDISLEEYPGPVHIALPADVSEKAAVAGRGDAAGDILDRPVKPELPEQMVVEQQARVRQLIMTSERPVIAAGLTAARLFMRSELLKLLSDRQIPVIVTPMAKEVIPHDHPCFAGVLFHALSDRLKVLVEKADLVIGLGYDPVEYNYESWLPEVPLLHLGTVECDLPFGGVTQVISEPSSWFSLLHDLKQSQEMMTLCAGVRRDIKAALMSDFPGFSPVEAVSIINDTLPADAIVTADVGSHLHLLGQQLKVPAQGRFIITNGWSSMGFGIPAANAAALCYRGRSVVCVTGDGGFAMSAGEMLTARRYGLKTIVVVFADGELNLIRLKEERRGVLPAGVELYAGHLFDSNAFFGVRVMHASTPTAFRKALKEALALHEPVIIEIAIDPSAYKSLIVT